MKRNRLKAVEWFEDRDSATNLQRKSFQELQAAIFAGKIDTVVVWKLDRLAPIGSFPTSSGLNMRPNLPIGTLRGICVNGLVETTHSDFGPARRAGETKIAMAHALLASTSVIEQLLNSFPEPSCRAKYGKCGKTLRSVARPLGRQGIAHYRGRAARAKLLELSPGTHHYTRGAKMKRERCAQCGESVWIEDDVRPRWTPERNCCTCVERAGIIRQRSEPLPPRQKERMAA